MQILTTETIKLCELCAIHVLTFGQYVKRVIWRLSPLAHAWRRHFEETSAYPTTLNYFYNYRAYAVVTCKIKLFENYFSLRRRPSEIILFQRMEICLKLFQNYFTGILQLINIFQHVRCR